MNEPQEEKSILVVVSKLKSYIRSVSGMSTSANVAPRLSDAIRSLCDQAIEKAKAEGRKTVMDRDFD
jgi:histone H3/H4